MKAVRFDHYGGVDVLEVREVEDPVAGAGEVLVTVKAAGINPGEIAIREGFLHGRFPGDIPLRRGDRSRRCGGGCRRGCERFRRRR